MINVATCLACLSFIYRWNFFVYHKLRSHRSRGFRVSMKLHIQLLPSQYEESWSLGQPVEGCSWIVSKPLAPPGDGTGDSVRHSRKLRFSFFSHKSPSHSTSSCALSPFEPRRRILPRGYAKLSRLPGRTGAFIVLRSGTLTAGGVGEIFRDVPWTEEERNPDSLDGLRPTRISVISLAHRKSHFKIL